MSGRPRAGDDEAAAALASADAAPSPHPPTHPPLPSPRPASMNEPEVGTTLDPQNLASKYLYPLYARLAQAVTGVRDGLPTCVISPLGGLPPAPCAYPDLGVRDTRHLLFAEPTALRNQLDFSPNSMGPWTTYPHIVHTPHVYTHVFTIDQEIPALNLTWPPSWSFAYDTALAEASAMNAAIFVTEFGTGMLEDASHVIPTMNEAERHGVGNTLWSWKSNCVGCTNDTWTTFLIPQLPATPDAIPQNGPLFASRRALLGRVHNRGALGEVLGFFYNQSSQAYSFAANASEGHLAVVGAQREREAAACARGGGGGGGGGARARYLLLPGDGGWALCRGGGGPPLPADIAVAAADFLATLPRALAANGTVTELFVPPNVAANATAVANAELVGMVAWPDGSRSAFFRPLAPGVYSLAVPPAEAHGGWRAADAVEAMLAARPTAADGAAALSLATGEGRRALDAWGAVVRDGMRRAGVELSGPWEWAERPTRAASEA